MSDSILGYVLGLIVIAILVFTGPIYQNFDTGDRLVDSIAQDVVDKYDKDICKSGYIDQKTYMNFLDDLSRTGEVYDIQMIHTSRLVFPSITNSDDYEIHEVKYGRDVILNTIKDGTSKYTMRYGDDFKIEITETSPAPSRLLSSIFSGKGIPPLLPFGKGGMVENEVVE
ncbi:hypothetical protein [uncultured Clostridium sp.]|uniref:hypothetical protein n=1 Tax=uncultured Clostridium sp. TaxID=59620 RepID=UPI0028E1B427|nr:hypothetical protein [uncultured Clostridium sp.]